MIKHIWSVLAQESSIDNSTNILSLFKILERVDVTVTLPIVEGQKFDAVNVPMNYTLVSLWSRSEAGKEESIRVKVEVINPRQEKIELGEERDLVFPNDKLRMRDVVTIQGLVAKGSGIYTFVVKEKKGKKYEVVAEVPLEIVINNLGTN